MAEEKMHLIATQRELCYPTCQAKIWKVLRKSWSNRVAIWLSIPSDFLPNFPSHLPNMASFYQTVGSTCSIWHKWRVQNGGSVGVDWEKSSYSDLEGERWIVCWNQELNMEMDCFTNLNR
jgi:hypothetical protein